MMKIRVTEEDIVGGSRANPYSCPIARAAKRQGIGRVEVGAKYLWLGNRKFEMPSKALNFIKCFDSNRHVESIEFEAKEVEA